MKSNNKKSNCCTKTVLSILLGVSAAILGIWATGESSVFAEEPVTNLNIEAGVSEIGAYAYTERPLQTVTLPDSVANIGYGAFEECTDLKSVNLNNGLSSIDGHAFSQCFELNNVTIPATVQNLGNAAFHNCVSLDSVSIPASVQNLENNVFYGCTSLSNVSLPEGMQSIGQQTFYGCLSLSSMAVPSTVSDIKDGAFYNCQNLQEVVLGDAVQNIGRDAFAGCGKVVIVCNPGSYAEKYAKDNGIAYRYAGEAANETTAMTENSDVNAEVITEFAQTNESSAANQNPASQGNPNKKNYNVEEAIVYTPQTGIDIPYLQMTILLILSITGMLGFSNNEKIKL